MAQTFSVRKDPDAELDYTMSWVEWLAEASDTISTSLWIAEAGITIASQSNTTTAATVWLSDGTNEENYEVTNRITTIGGRTDDRTIIVKVRNR